MANFPCNDHGSMFLRPRFLSGTVALANDLSMPWLQLRTDVQGTQGRLPVAVLDRPNGPWTVADPTMRTGATMADADDPGAEIRPLVAYTDGSGTIATKPSGCGVVICDGDEVILEASRHLGLGSNNHAEVSAVRVALWLTRDMGRPLHVRADSDYAIKALTKEWDPWPTQPNARLITLTREAMVGRVVTFEHVPGHEGIAGNERADMLASIGRTTRPRWRCQFAPAIVIGRWPFETCLLGSTVSCLATPHGYCGWPADSPVGPCLAPVPRRKRRAKGTCAMLRSRHGTEVRQQGVGAHARGRHR